MRLSLIASLITILFQSSFSVFDPCKFNFGTAWDGNAKDYSEVDYITIWAGSDENFNQNWIGSMLQKCKSLGKTPVLYSYIIAFTARNDLGLKDCNGGTPNLCQQGAKYIREKKTRIMGQYDKYITGVRNSFGTIDPVIWLMEPDFYQYCSGNQDGGVLSSQDAGQLVHEIVQKIKATLPNAVISMDISPWVPSQSSWFSNFQMNDFAFMNTTGGQTAANSNNIRNSNSTTWREIHDLSQKCIIADDGYATEGSSIGHDPAWDDINNLKNRISDGVIAITQAFPKSDWANTIKTLRSQLPKPVCPCQNLIKTKFSLSITTTGSGKVSINPLGASFDSGATVTLTAKPETGETFIGWSGALSGTIATETLIMSSDKSVGASFSSNIPMSYTLTIQTSGSGTVTVTPQASAYTSGTSVTLTAKPGTGAKFLGWGGALSGSSNPATLIIDSDKTVTATFYGGIVAGNLVKNGDFTTNADNWGLGVYESAKTTGGASNGKYTVTTQTTGGAEWNIQFSQSGIKLEQGKTYKLSFMASAQSNTTLQVNVGMSASPYTSYSQLQTVNLITHDSVYSITFPMNEASTSDARLEFNGGKTSGTWSIDDVVLIDPTSVHVKNPPKVREIPAGISGFLFENERITVTLYNHCGRIVGRFSGTYAELHRQRSLGRSLGKTGLYLVTVQRGNRRSIEKFISLE